MKINKNINKNSRKKNIFDKKSYKKKKTDKEIRCKLINKENRSANSKNQKLKQKLKDSLLRDNINRMQAYKQNIIVKFYKSYFIFILKSF